MIHRHRVYDGRPEHHGFCVLIDRLWPRGISKDGSGIDEWFKELAPSNELRKWYQHDHDKWEEFRSRYFQELGDKGPLLIELIEKAAGRDIVLIYGSREREYNNARALKEYLENIITGSTDSST